MDNSAELAGMAGAIRDIQQQLLQLQQDRRPTRPRARSVSPVGDDSFDKSEEEMGSDEDLWGFLPGGGAQPRTDEGQLAIWRLQKAPEIEKIVTVVRNTTRYAETRTGGIEHALEVV